ncbi:p53-like transcription factor, partial [Ramicandelaber brevisporus]
ISLEAKLDKGFTPTTDSSEWTCYRRNYFQVLAAFRLDHPDDIKSKHQQSALSVVGSYNVIQFKIGISARVHGSDRSIQLTQYTAKRDKGPQNAPLQMDCAPGGSVESYHFAPSHSVQLFERLQFKQATQNNGKRKAAQQHYSLVVELFAVCHGGTQHLISTATSGPLVVRGRSPGHYGE